jgi:hypothetical protein
MLAGQGDPMNSLWQDVRYSLARLYGDRTPHARAGDRGQHHHLFVDNSTLLNPIPGVARTGELMAVSLGKNAQAAFPLTYPDFEQLRDRNHSFTGLGCSSMTNTMNLTGSGKPERIWGTVASCERSRN